MEGELVAEYVAGVAPSAPQQEYGYRNGELLVTASSAPSTAQRTNFALSTNGGVASASSVASSNFPASAATNGDRKGLNWGAGGGWLDAPPNNAFPDWLQIDFQGQKTTQEVDVFSVQDNYSNPSEPTQTMTFSLYGLTSFDVQYWNGSAWVTVPGGSVTGNNLAWRRVTFPAVTTTKIRVLTNASVDGWSRLTEVEAYGTGTGSGVELNWVVTDQIGTPRMIADKSGSLSGIRRHDYLPFGEEMMAGSGNRTVAGGYVADSVRQKLTGKERDNEMELDYFLDRYYSSTPWISDLLCK